MEREAQIAAHRAEVEAEAKKRAEAAEFARIEAIQRAE